MINQVYQITFDDLIIRNEAEKLTSKDDNGSRIIKEFDINEIAEMFDIDLDI